MTFHLLFVTVVSLSLHGLLLTHESVSAAPLEVKLSRNETEESPPVVEEGVKSDNESESLDVDFVNLPGYGVVDEANSTTNGSFTCYERHYGYYADVSKECLMFHLCYPIREPASGQIVYQRFSFVCSEDAVFDQQHLVCVDNESVSIICEDSPSFFEASNEKLIESLQRQQQQQQQQQQFNPYPFASKSNETSDIETLLEQARALNGTDEEGAAAYGLVDSWFG